jgi:Domain of unknown function (DUF4124)
MKIKTGLLAGLMLCGLFTGAASAKLFKWVDDQGVTHLGDTIPPEYAEKNNVLMNEKGRVVKKNIAATAEEKLAAKEKAEQKRNEDQIKLDQKRRDQALLNTYSNEKEIDLARARNLQQVEARINSIHLLQASAQESLAGYRKEREGLVRANKKIPDSLQSDVSLAERKLEKLKGELLVAEEKSAAVKANSDAEKVRYLELTVQKK